MNLENLGLVELNAQEVKEVEGGFWLELLIVVAIAIIAYCAATDGNENTITIVDGVRVGN